MHLYMAVLWCNVYYHRKLTNDMNSNAGWDCISHSTNILGKCMHKVFVECPTYEQIWHQAFFIAGTRCRTKTHTQPKVPKMPWVPSEERYTHVYLCRVPHIHMYTFVECPTYTCIPLSSAPHTHGFGNRLFILWVPGAGLKPTHTQRF